MSQPTLSPESVNSTMDRLASIAHETIDRVTPAANHAEHDARGAATRAADRAKVLQDQAAAAVEDRVRKTRAYAQSNPLVTAGIAFAVGALLSTLIRR
jgi:ElaB/YqjD/DUF883 family membrane-anchored ribosome-binding protein